MMMINNGRREVPMIVCCKNLNRYNNERRACERAARPKGNWGEENLACVCHRERKKMAGVFAYVEREIEKKRKGSSEVGREEEEKKKRYGVKPISGFFFGESGIW
jgi:hypothetical protein